MKGTLTINPETCNGCVLCLTACPAKAIRVRNGSAKILSGLCSACGICYRVCPRSAVEAARTSQLGLARFRHSVAIPDPALFTQFGYAAQPNQILLALKALGFKEVVDLSWVCEMVGAAFEECLASRPWPRPGISPTCPAVVWLISQNYPALVRNLIPVLPPRTLAAKWVKKRLAKRLNISPHELGVFFISMCPAHRDALEDPLGIADPFTDGVICLGEVYDKILEALKRPDEDKSIQKSSAGGLAWAARGGQTGFVRVPQSLAVSGHQDVVQILDMLEAGQLPELQFLELQMCPGGCLAGPFAVENRYRAESIIHQLVREQTQLSRLERAVIERWMKEGFFDWEGELRSRGKQSLAPEPRSAIERLNQINELYIRLPQTHCGVCGSPDCKTFAEDVVLGRAHERDCLMLQAAAAEFTPAPAAQQDLLVSQLVSRLDLTVSTGAQGLGRRVSGCFVSDLVSEAMATARLGSVWVTGLGGEPVIAAAIAKDLAAVILTGARRPRTESLDLAQRRGLPLLLTHRSTLEIAARIHELGLTG